MTRTTRILLGVISVTCLHIYVSGLRIIETHQCFLLLVSWGACILLCLVTYPKEPEEPEDSESIRQKIIEMDIYANFVHLNEEELQERADLVDRYNRSIREIDDTKEPMDTHG